MKHQSLQSNLKETVWKHFYEEANPELDKTCIVCKTCHVNRRNATNMQFNLLLMMPNKEPSSVQVSTFHALEREK